MLDSFIYSFNSVAPIFMLVLVGMMLKKIGFLDDNYCKIADKLVFKIALPLELFKSVSRTEIKSIFAKETTDVIIFFLIGIVIAFLILCFTVPLFLKENSKRGVFIQGATRANFAIFAVPLATNMFGEEGKIASTLILPVVTIVFNILAVIVLTMYAPKDAAGKKSPSDLVKQTFLSIIKNPLIIGIMFGFAFSFFFEKTGTKMPVFLSESISDIASLAVPLALISIGVNFKPENLKGRIGTAFFGMCIKNIILPAIALTVAILIGIRGISLAMILIAFGSPTSVASYVMAKNMHGDHELAGQILLLTTVCSLVTMFVFIFILKQFSFI